jgi:low temperature requirement protein LtrA
LRVRTPSHPHHITERYGLFTLILLGESLLASANAIIQAINEADHITPLVVLAGAALVIVAGMWWIYFSPDQTVHIASFRRTLAFGYLHGIIFAAAGALSSGIEVAVDVITDTSELGAIEAALTTTVPVGLFVAGIWALSIRPTLSRAANATIVVLIAVVFASALVPLALVVAALAVAGIVVVLERSALRSGGTHRVLAVARPVTATATTEEP